MSTTTNVAQRPSVWTFNLRLWKENNYYDTHNLDYIEKTKGDIESRIEYLTENLPVKNTEIGDYDWDFDKGEIVFLNVA